MIQLPPAIAPTSAGAASACLRVPEGARGPLLGALALLILPGCSGASFIGSVLRLPSAEPVASADAHTFVPPSAYEAYLQGEVLLAQGDAGGAVRALSMAAAFADDDVYVLTRLALAQDRAGDRAAAANTLQLAEHHAPCHPSLWEVRGQLHVDHEELPEAVAAFERGLGCAPRSVDARLRLSALLQRVGRHAEALALLPTPSGTQPEPIRLVVARALSAASAAELAFTFESWLSEGPVESETLLRGVERALALGAPRLAARLLDHVRTDVGLGLRGRVLAAMGDREALRALLAATPLIDDAITTAELSLAAGDLERATQEATRAVQDAPSDRAQAVLARAEAGRGDASAALAAADAIEKPELRHALERELLAAFVTSALADEFVLRGAELPAARGAARAQ